MELDVETLEVRNLVYTESGMIACEIRHYYWGWIPFGASPNDPEEYGRKIFEYAVSGKWGPVAPYVPPVEPVLSKASREQLVSEITVTTTQGNTFDGDEASQDRMARTIVSLQSQPEGSTVQWILADNTVIDVGLAELQEALTLASQRQTELWVQA